MENSTLFANRSHTHTSPSDVLVFVLSVCLVMIEILGLVCNGIILTVYYKYSRLRTATNMFILNLAVCNLLLAVLQLVLSSPSFFKKQWLYGYGGCIAYGFVHQYLMSVAIITLAVIAFDRFCVITKPVRKLQTFILTKPRAKLLIGITHVYSFVFTFPLLVGWNKLTSDERYNTGCSLHYSSQSYSSLAYTITSTIFTCILPLIITVYCYALIYKSVRKSSQRCTLYQSKRNTIYKESGPRKKSLYHTRTARMITIVMFFFLLTWLPTRVTGLLAAFGCPVSPLAVYICVFFTKSCIMYNAVVYVFLNLRFRAAFLHLTYVCRQDSRLRFTTDATNASIRNLGEILPSVVETNDRSRVLSQKTLSQLSFLPTFEIPEFSSCSTGRLSNGDLSRPTRDPSETPRESSVHNRKASLLDRGSSDNDSRAIVDLEISLSGSTDSASTNTEIRSKDLGTRKEAEKELIGSHHTNVGFHVSEKNNGLASTEISQLSDSVGQHRNDISKEFPTEKQDAVKFDSNNTEQSILHKSGLSSTKNNPSAKTNYGFNNPGLHEDDEISENEKRIETYLELDINSLSNIT